MSSFRWQLKIAVGILGVLLIGLSVVNYYRAYVRALIHLTISGGNICPLRSRMASTICREVDNAGVRLERADSTNSEAICSAVEKGEFDLGLVLGGFPPSAYPNIRQVAALGVDPLHFVIRRELTLNGPPNLDTLRGRRVSLGEAGSNGALLAESLVRLAGLEPVSAGQAGDFHAEYLPERDLRQSLEAILNAPREQRATLVEALPDALFVVDSLPAPIVDELVATGGYVLVPLPFAEALHLDSRRDRNRPYSSLEHSRLESVKIPASTYGINPPIPATDCETIGLRLLLVANKNTSPTGVHRVLQALDGGVAQRYQIDFDTTEENSEFPLHAGAAAFAQGRRPVVLGEFLGSIGDFFSVLGAAGAGAFAIWGFLRGLRRVHPNVHLRQVDRIERLLRGDERDTSAPELPRDLIDYLETRLSAVKQAVIDDYSHGRLERDEALVGILTLIADTRHLLVQRRTQLGLHEPRHEFPGRLADAA